MPVKRPRSPSPSGSPDRRQASMTNEHGGPSGSSGSKFNESARLASAHTLADLFPYQEIFLRILSFLSPTELATAQSVSRHWSRMSLDPQLWKRLYLGRYPHPHHSRLIYKTAANRLNTPSRPLRPISRLPSRAFPPPSPSRSPSVASLIDQSSSPAQERIASRLISGTGRARPLSLEDSNTNLDVGYGIRNDGVDWKMMLRVGTNWSNGNAVSEATLTLPPSPSSSIRSNLDIGLDHPRHPPPYSEQHIALFPTFIFTSNPTSPLIHAYLSSSANSSVATSALSIGVIPPPPGWSSPSRPDNVTAICADQSVVLPDGEATSPGTGVRNFPARLAVFYQSGGFVILHIRIVGPTMGMASVSAQRGLKWHRETIHPAQSRPRSLRSRATTYIPLEGDPVVLASLHYPVLLTCTIAFHLSVYTLVAPLQGGAPTRPNHLQTNHSDVSSHPAALSLFPYGPGEEVIKERDAPDVVSHFRAALTYCAPMYPSSWTVAVQEFAIHLVRTGEGDQPFSGDVTRGDCWKVGRGDEGDDTDRVTWPRRVRPIVGVKGGHAVGVGTDGRWAVLAGADNQIQVYSLPTPSSSPPPSSAVAQRPKSGTTLLQAKPGPIVHSQTLLAHSAAITSISLSAGRCVSGGRDGRVLVWELDDNVSDDEDGPGRLGRTVGYVEVRQGGRRETWRGAAGPDDESEMPLGIFEGLPHPASISAAARSLFLPLPPALGRPTVTRADGRPMIRQLAFDEEKIVGLLSGSDGRGGALTADVMKVWSFNN